MAVFRVERTRDYIVMSNCHLRDRRHQTTDAKGKFSGNEYVIYERPAENRDGMEEKGGQPLWGTRRRKTGQRIIR